MNLVELVSALFQPTLLSLYCSHFVLVVPRSGKGQLLSCSCEVCPLFLDVINA